MDQTSFFEEDQQDGTADEARASGDVMRVLVPYPVDKAYDYIVPLHMDVAPGDYVCVPLMNREISGVVWGEATGDVNPKKLKAIISKYDLDPMPKVGRDFIDWVAGYTLGTLGSVLKMSLSAPAGLTPPKPARGFRRNRHFKIPAKGLSAQRKKVLEIVADRKTRIASELADMAGCSAAVIKGMAAKDMLEEVSVYNPAPCLYPDYKNNETDLSEDQRMVADELCDDVRAGVYSASLLDGVTGAGKTEVYFEAVAEALKQGQQVVILLPEIALSNAFLKRFKSRFGCAPALWHSHLTPAQRRSAWRGVAQGDSRVVVGARSALFLPYKNLGLIIVDEEHDPAYKQEDGVIYNARDMAVVRAHLGKIPVCLVSATPSLETMLNAWEEPLGSGRYKHLILESRFGGAVLPDISVVDLRADRPDRQCFLSSAVLEAVQKTLDAGDQSLLFLNRRGYAPLTLCRTCGHRFECPRCTAWLVEHRSSGRLHCHHCGFQTAIPKNCPECDDMDSLAACGPGVERIFEEAKLNFPDARIMILASDTADSNEELKAMLDEIIAGEVDIIIGTQIIAKGHHFPNLTFVGVIDADLGLKGGDLRAAERTYQMLHQVAGRAGREQKRGHVILQSWMPDHRIMKAMASSSHGGGRDEFLSVEAAEREAANMPPYSRLVAIIISGREESLVFEVAKALGRASPQGVNDDGLRIQTLGPAPAPMARLRGRYRYRLLVRADKAINIQKTVAHWVHGVKTPSTVRVYIDIDPQSFL
ncbi:MAG: primosomal protein N' [Zetaproteobacteria bacterium]|nr:MAG: primosomal protein N' [Zetaproteobacteria bacterium]